MIEANLVGDFLRHWAEERGDAPALIWGEQRYDYATYHRQVEVCRAALAHAGIGRGDRVAVLAPPRPEVMILFTAITDLGAIFLGLNSRGTETEHRLVLDDAQPKLVFAVADHLDRCYREELAALARDYAPVITIDTAVAGVSEGLGALIAKTHGCCSPDAAPDDPAVLVYTSGSTGRPKGALVTHRSLIAGMRAQATAFSHVSPVRMLFPVPIHHLGSVGNCGTTCLILGGSIVFMDNFSPRAALDLMAKEQVTVWAQVPTMFLMQLSLPDFDPTAVAHVQSIFFAGSAMPAEGVETLAKLGIPMVTGYGLTETSGPVTLSLPGTPIEALSATIGSPVPGVELKIADDDGRPVPDGVEGEIVVRGDCIFAGYFNNPGATAAALDSDGWFRSGDLAVQQDGLIAITGRKQEAFKCGGANVYPREIEDVLQRHPDVAIACVVSAPDPIYQEVAVAYVVPRDGCAVTAEALRDHCAEHLTKYKVPRRFVLRSTLPTIGIGKVDRAQLKAEARVA